MQKQQAVWGVPVRVCMYTQHAGFIEKCERERGRQMSLHQVSFPEGSWEYFSSHLAVHEKKPQADDKQRARRL